MSKRKPRLYRVVIPGYLHRIVQATSKADAVRWVREETGNPAVRNAKRSEFIVTKYTEESS